MKDKGYGIGINWHYIGISLFFTAVITLLVLYMPDFREIDYGMMKWVQSVVPPFPQVVLLVISEYARYNFVWPLIAASGILISHRYYLQAAMLILFTQFAYFITNLTKGIMCRERPCGDIYPEYSFPSGHSLINMCFWGILIYLVNRYTSGFWKYFLTTVFGLLIVIVGISRLSLGVHFPTDVLAGMFIGLILVNLYIILDKVFNR